MNFRTKCGIIAFLFLLMYFTAGAFLICNAIAAEGGDEGDNGGDPICVTCPPGEDGAKGDKGDKGDTGATGLSGKSGRNGKTGATGSTGATGPQGPQGIPGENCDGDKYAGGISGAMALSYLPRARLGKSAVGMSAGFWDSETAWAFGGGHSFDTKRKDITEVGLRAGVFIATDGDVGFGAGVGFHF